MTILLSRMVYWLCSLYLLVVPLAAAWMLLDLDTFRYVMQGFMNTVELPWQTVSDGQMYALWGLSVVFLAVPYLLMLFLQRSFRSFARGNWFDLNNSRHLRSAAIVLLVNVIASPLYMTLAVLLLTVQQPPGEQLLFVGVGMGEFRMIASGLVLWVLADLLVRGMEAESENQQFI